MGHTRAILPQGRQAAVADASQARPGGFAAMPPGLDAVLSAPGQPLDAGLRQMLEPRFGHDFGRVRVHADAEAADSARGAGALAYTVGQDLVFGAGQYRPHDAAGRLLIAHELAHSVQQQGSTPAMGAHDEVAERAADQAALGALFGRPARLAPGAVPRVQFRKVSSGAFGKALEEFTDTWSVPDQAIHLLRKSPSFMKIVAQLEEHYVYAYDFFKTVPLEIRPMPGADGRIDRPPFRGKRVLFEVVFAEPSFTPFGVARGGMHREFEGDLIAIHETSDIPGFIAEIAHEASHAARFVGGRAVPAKTIMDEVQAAIADEVDTRKSEAKILGEIPDPDVQARAAQVGHLDPARVERDFAPAVGLTYLENVVFAVRLREAKKKDGLTNEEAQALREQVDKDMASKAPAPLYFKPRTGPMGTYELSDYAEVWFQRAVARREWAEFQDKHPPSDPGFEAARDKLLRAHANRYFEGRVSYKPLRIDI